MFTLSRDNVKQIIYICKKFPPAVTLLNKGTDTVQHRNGSRTLWFHTRMALSRLNKLYDIRVEFRTDGDEIPRLFMKGIIMDDVHLHRSFNQAIRSAAVDQMLSHPYQGAHLTAVAADGASSKFISDGRYISIPSYSCVQGPQSTAEPAAL